MDGSLPLHIRQNLRQLGLTDHDVLIITFLFHADKASVESISRQTAISYSTCEYLCNNLHRMGVLILMMEKGSQVFSLCSEHEFLAWMEDKKRKIVDEYRSSMGDMQQFFKSHREKSWKPEFLYFQGVEGIKDIYEDMLTSKTPIYGWRDIPLIQKFLGKTFLDEYIKRRADKGIQSLAIMPDNATNRKYSAQDQKRTAKFLKGFSIPGEIRVYDGKTAIISFHKNNLVGFLLTSEIIYNIFKTIFDQTWKA